jgi:hypothetical protein
MKISRLLLVALLVLNGSTFADTPTPNNSSVQLDTTIPQADGVLTADQIPPIILDTNAKASSASNAQATIPALPGTPIPS